MSSDPLVSVIIPTYNRAEVICRAIDSVLGQTYKKIEVIVVDDGSTDETTDKLSVYGEKIQILAQANTGPTVARNRGIKAANGEIVAFLDSDDYWLPTKLFEQIRLLEKAGTSAPCCLCNCSTIFSDGTKSSTFRIADTEPDCGLGLWLNPAEVLTTRFVIFSQAVAIRKKVLDRIGYFDECLPFYCEDHELALRLSREGPWALIRDELVVCTNGGPGSLGQKALREEVRLRNDIVYVHRQNVNFTNRRHDSSELRNLAHRELKRAQRDLLVAKIAARSFAGAKTISKLMRSVERIRRALFRRSISYPKMKVRQLS